MDYVIADSVYSTVKRFILYGFKLQFVFHELVLEAAGPFLETFNSCTIKLVELVLYEVEGEDLRFVCNDCDDVAPESHVAD